MANPALDRATAAPAAVMHASSAPAQRGLGSALRGLWTDARGLVREHAVLAVLEAQRAGTQLAFAMAAVVVVSVLAVTAWLAIVTALIVWLASEDVPWPGVLLIAALLNLVGAAAVGWWARSQFTEKPFAATLRQLSAARNEISVTADAHIPRP